MSVTLTSEERDDAVRRLRLIRPSRCTCHMLTERDGTRECVMHHIDAVLAALTREQAPALPASPFDKRAADRLADEVAVLIQRGVVDTRSLVADALLDYRDPPLSERAIQLFRERGHPATAAPASEQAGVQAAGVSALVNRAHDVLDACWREAGDALHRDLSAALAQPCTPRQPPAPAQAPCGCAELLREALKSLACFHDPPAGPDCCIGARIDAALADSAGEWELVADHVAESLMPLSALGMAWQPGDRVLVYRRRKSGEVAR